MVRTVEIARFSSFCVINTNLPHTDIVSLSQIHQYYFINIVSKSCILHNESFLLTHLSTGSISTYAVVWHRLCVHLWPVGLPTNRIVNDVPEGDVNLEHESRTLKVISKREN